MKVFVYYNLRKHCWSVRNVNTGKVILHTNDVVIRSPRFKVSAAGRARVLREKRKNVHAGVEGELGTYADMPTNATACFRVKYNPYKYDSFVMEDEQPIYSANLAVMRDRIVWAI